MNQTPNGLDLATLNCVTLYYREGTADKVYRAEIVPAGNDLYQVNFAFGRRGSTLQTGTKTTTPVPRAKARAVFEKLVCEKTGKGYTPGEDGTPYQQTAAGQRQTGLACQLLNPITADRLPQYLADPAFVAQEKFDGRRLLVRKQGTEVVGSNRQGLEVALPVSIATAVAGLPTDGILDGEAVGDVLHVFDLLAVNGTDLRARPYAERLAALQYLLQDAGVGPLRVVPTAQTTADKLALCQRLQDEGREGLVLKDRRAPYTSGRPASGGNQVKFKFYETASCLVTDHNDQRNVALGLLADGRVVPCGNVSIPVNQDVPVVGAVVEVRYLYAFPQSHALYQPVYLGRRDDLAREDCGREQLKYQAA